MILSKKRKFFFLFILFAGIFACLAMILPKSQRPPKVKIDNFPIPKQLIARDTTYFAMYRNRGVQVKIILPEKQLKGMILLLPGWNLPDLDWSTKTSVCSKALSMNFGLVFVEMGKSVYMDSFYPSMRKDYKFYPTRTWLWDTVIKPLQQYGWFTPGSPSFVLGLSTGARGALILGIENSCCIKAVAGLSGDYNPLLDTKDGLMVNTLGAYEKNPFRWRGTNNISLRSEELKCHVFLAHGENDQIVPIAQSLDLWYRLDKLKVEKSILPYKKQSHATTLQKSLLKRSVLNKDPKNVCFLTVKGANHDYQFWEYAGLKALDFFAEVNAAK
jgi:S-formylglutathione hydrolase FrmB